MSDITVDVLDTGGVVVSPTDGETVEVTVDDPTISVTAGMALPTDVARFVVSATEPVNPTPGLIWIPAP